MNQSVAIEDRLGRLPDKTYEATLVFSDMLSRGWQVSRYPGNVVLGQVEGDKPPVAFVGLTSTGTTFGAMTVSRGVVSGRLVLAQAGMPVPECRTFTAKALKTAREFAESLGYPVLVSGPKGQSPLKVASTQDLRSTMELRQAEGAPQKVVVSQWSDHLHMKALVLNSQVLAVDQPEEVFHRLHPDIRALLGEAGAAFAGLDLAEVSVLIEDPGASRHGQQVLVTGVEFAPRLRTYSRALSSSQELLAALVQYYSGSTAGRGSSDRARVAVTFSGVADPAGLNTELERFAAELESMSVVETLRAAGEELQLHCQGSANTLAFAGVQAMNGFGAKALSAHSVTMTPTYESETR